MFDFNVLNKLLGREKFYDFDGLLAVRLSLEDHFQEANRTGLIPDNYLRIGVEIVNLYT